MNEAIRERYGIPKGVTVKTFDYSSIPTYDLLRRIEELRARVKESDDATLEDSLDINELFALESELERRVKDRESVLSLSEELAGLMTPGRVRLLAVLQLVDGVSSIKELAKRLGRPEKSVARDVEVLFRHGLVVTRDVVDRQGKRREVQAGAHRLILVTSETQDSPTAIERKDQVAEEAD
jgi:predicted transcriptional regulator